MRANKTVTSGQWQVTSADSCAASLVTSHSSFVTRSAFSLIEIMVVVSLLSLIVLALMAVFNSTQRAFRASVTQADVLEGSRAAVDLIAADLHAATPSYGVYFNGAANFVVSNNASYSTPLVQTLPGSSSSISRNNLLQQVFVLNHQNTKWWGVGYAVMTNSSDGLYSLYRLQYPPPPGTSDLTNLFNSSAFQNFFQNPTNGGSHIIDGVVHFVVRAYDMNGIWVTNGYAVLPTNSLKNTWFFPVAGSEVGFAMFSNNVPAAVDIDLGVLEDQALARAESLPTTPVDRRTPFLQGQAGAVHVFHQRVTIPNVDRTAYNQ
jgi:Tfp pilus assembly protein PilV